MIPKPELQWLAIGPELITAVGAFVDGEAPGCASCLMNMEGE